MTFSIQYMSQKEAFGPAAVENIKMVTSFAYNNFDKHGKTFFQRFKQPV